MEDLSIPNRPALESTVENLRASEPGSLVFSADQITIEIDVSPYTTLLSVSLLENAGVQDFTVLYSTEQIPDSFVQLSPPLVRLYIYLCLYQEANYYVHVYT